jgi:short-subunit dehydrogenase
MPPLPSALEAYRVVVVTGGSSGIGTSFIRLLGTVSRAPAICNISRREPDWKTCGLLEGLRHHFACDLSTAGAATRVAREVEAWVSQNAPEGRVLLINNSGGGAFGPFPEPGLGRQLEMIDLNVRAVVELTASLLPLLRIRGGAILTVASTVAFQPAPYAATYAATKAFVLHWSIALDRELRGSGVRAVAVCPGTTRTAFFTAAGMGSDAFFTPGMDPDEVARLALEALCRGRPLVVPGWFNRLYTWLGARLPKTWAAALAGRVLARRRFRKDGV